MPELKKAAILFLAALTLLSLAACVTKSVYIEPSGNPSDIQKVEVYRTEERYTEADVDDLRDENTPLCIIDSQRQTEFLEELHGLAFEEEIVLFPVPLDGGCTCSGYVISIVYEDGSYDIIAEQGQFYYSIGSNGDGRYEYDSADYCGDLAWTDFLEGYIEG